MAKEAATHRPYLHMITEALTALKDWTGSSVPAIAKFLEEKYGESLPGNFRKMLTVQLKRLVKSESLVKVRNSFKFASGKKKAATTTTTAKKVKAAEETKNKDTEMAKGKKVGNNKGKEKSKKKKKKKSVNPKASEPKKVVKKAIKTKRLSLVKSPEGMKKNAAGGAKESKTKKVGKSGAPGKSTKKKPDVAAITANNK